jgi:alpha-galactosidase
MLAAPLLAGNDLPNMKPEIKAILTNKDVIAIDQDRSASRASAPTPTAKSKSGPANLQGGALAIAVINHPQHAHRNPEPRHVAGPHRNV